MRSRRHLIITLLSKIIIHVADPSKGIIGTLTPLTFFPCNFNAAVRKMFYVQRKNSAKIILGHQLLARDPQNTKDTQPATNPST